MPRISEVNINTVEYWDTTYREKRFPTLALNNLNRYRAAAELQVGDSALDIGCGQGGLGRALSQVWGPGIRYVGIDQSTIGLATTVYPPGVYAVMDWREASFQADTVYVLELIEHVDEPAVLVAKAAGLARRRLVIGTPRYQEIGSALHHGEHQWDFTEDEIRALLSPYGKVGPLIPAGSQCLVVAVDL